MNRNELINRYFDWMYQLVVDDRYSESYHKLFSKLFDTDFTYTIPMDGNRAEDGIDLRYRFGHECLYPDSMIACLLDDRPCSILEMMIALALRCEEHIMDDPEIGDRTGKWFWIMLDNLGLGSMTDENYDPILVNDIIHRFLSHEYCRNGEGGLFTISNPPHDMRNTDIWYQMNWYLSENIKKGSF